MRTDPLVIGTLDSHLHFISRVSPGEIKTECERVNTDPTLPSFSKIVSLYMKARDGLTCMNPWKHFPKSS